MKIVIAKKKGKPAKSDKIKIDGEFATLEEAKAEFMGSWPFQFIECYRVAYVDNKKEMKEFNFLASQLGNPEDNFEQAYSIDGRIVRFGVTRSY